MKPKALSEVRLEECLELARARHDQRLQTLTTEGVPLQTAARSRLCSSQVNRSYVGRLVPAELTMAEYIVHTTEQDEEEAEHRLRLCCEECPPRGGACDGLERPGEGPVWRDEIRWLGCVKWPGYLIDRKLRRGGFPEELVSKTFEDFRAYSMGLQDALSMVRRYIELFGGQELKLSGKTSINLSGSTGTGKTHLAVSVVRELLQLRKIESAQFYDTEYLLFLLRQHNEESRQVVERCLETDLLVLDDFNVAGASEWSVRQLAMVMNRRWGDRHPWLLTTNESLDEQRDHIGERIVSRMLGATIGIMVKGRDYRLEGIPNG